MKLSNRLKRIISAVALCFVFVLPAFLVSADVVSATGVDIQGEFGKTLQKAQLGTGKANVTSALGNVVNTFLGLIGVATFALVVYAGALWILAAGNEDKVEQAKGILKGAVIGLVIVFSAYVIVNFVLTSLQSALGSR